MSVCEWIEQFKVNLQDQDAVIGFISGLPVSDDQKYSILYQYAACQDITLDVKIKEKYGL